MNSCQPVYKSSIEPNKLTAFRKTKRMSPEDVRQDTLNTNCQAITDELQGAGIDGNGSKNNRADVLFGGVSHPPLGMRWMSV